MAAYRAAVDWRLEAGAQDFLAGRYGRGHTARFGSGVAVPATASAHVVGSRWAADGAVDPEEMFVGAVVSCHMLSFLHVARLAGFVVAAYRDEGEGVLGKTAEGRVHVARVTLRPQVDYAGAAPGAEEAARLHHLAHEACFIANSITTEVTVAPTS